MSNVHTSPQPVALDAVLQSLIVRIRPCDLDLYEYLGTRSTLEAEGCIPAGIDWPESGRSVKWEVGPLQFELKRTRPEGMKGPMKVWLSGDYWSLRCEPTAFVDVATRRLLKMREALIAEIHRQSPESQRKWNAEYEQYLNAQRDSAFQAFKNALAPRRRSLGRPRKATSLEQTKGDGA